MNRKLKKKIKSLIPPSFLMPLKIILSRERRLNVIEKNIQNIYNKLNNGEGNLKDQKSILRSNEYKIYSQNGEDGIIQYIFSKIGVKDKSFVEFGIEDGRECNTANLSLNYGWHGLLMDGSREEVRNAKYYYRNIMKIGREQVAIVHSFVTEKNINETLLKNGIKGEIDLLSIDIDGNDYYVWKAIDVIKPRVVVIEYNSFFGDEKSISVKYDGFFDRFEKHKSGRYYGASLAALAKLGRTKGYILVGCDSNGINSFFVRKDVLKNKLLRTLQNSSKFSKRSLKERNLAVLDAANFKNHVLEASRFSERKSQSFAKRFIQTSLSEIPVKKAYYPRREFGMSGTIKEFDKIKHLDYDEV